MVIKNGMKSIENEANLAVSDTWFYMDTMTPTFIAQNKFIL